jgi:hypothetical protein
VPGTVVQEWKCYDCGNVMMMHVPTPPTQMYKFNRYPNGTVSVDVVQTRQEEINEYWDERKKTIDSMIELDRWMTYYILNKQGMTIQGLDHQIEKALREKFPEEKKK